MECAVLGQNPSISMSSMHKCFPQVVASSYASSSKYPQKGAVSVSARHNAPEGDKTSINCSVTDEAFTGWFDSSGRKITSDSSQRIHVRADGSLKYLEISKVNRTDRGTYECRGKTKKAQVMLLVECMYHKWGSKLPKPFISPYRFPDLISRQT
ncbi:uncharacterized protein LOC110041407 isoform X2 [Orbicella faveolata]|uniref:uncharacterized protein LOC110041407 isoform X2 n=1 Tax=Orbicella faveolata TaxID=48498 RepID=UPI0009E521D6|nr:uncharacterized protein LOC110041407 isoform X2 [Orbicella faveolata]